MPKIPIVNPASNSTQDDMLRPMCCPGTYPEFSYNYDQVIFVVPTKNWTHCLCLMLIFVSL